MSFYEQIGIVIPGSILDTWPGPIQPALPAPGAEFFRAIISASLEDSAHPRKAVRRGLLHRGAKVLTTEEPNIWIHGGDVPARPGYYPLPNNPYPDEQEE